MKIRYEITEHLFEKSARKKFKTNIIISVIICTALLYSIETQDRIFTNVHIHDSQNYVTMLFDEVGWILGWKPSSRVDGEGLTRNVTSLVMLSASWYIREATAFLASLADRLDSDVVKL